MGAICLLKTRFPLSERQIRRKTKQQGRTCKYKRIVTATGVLENIVIGESAIHVVLLELEGQEQEKMCRQQK